ncbi:MAG TPA: GFA family protein [Povalibacter sp.]
MSTPAPLTGSCHCGNVRYAVHGDVVSVVNCHCSLCRSLSGAAFTSYVVVRESEFRVEQGQEFLCRYAATSKAVKHFCVSCGTPLFNLNPIDYPSLAMVYLGTASKGADLSPKINVYCENMLPWAGKVESIKSFGKSVVRGV